MASPIVCDARPNSSGLRLGAFQRRSSVSEFRLIQQSAAVGSGLLARLRSFIHLVDPASSHMLVSKVKPCMCVYNFLYDATANSSIIQLSIVHTCNFTWIPVVILELILEPESVVRE